MNTLPSFKTQYDKIIYAYFNNEIEPLDPHYCICGNLCNNTTSWFFKPTVEHCDSHGYKGNDFVRMEKVLLHTMQIKLKGRITDYVGNEPEYEEALFKGMCAAIEEMKKIHIEHGQIIEDTPVSFKKRELALK